jgi:hypothetical protein
VVFAAEHEFLLALDAKESVLGGLYYHFSDPETAYMDRVVVARAHRNRGVSDALMGEFKGRGVKALETGFLYPDYTMRFGFRTGPRHGGLFVPLDEEPPRAEPPLGGSCARDRFARGRRAERRGALAGEVISTSVGRVGQPVGAPQAQGSGLNGDHRALPTGRGASLGRGR